MAAILYCTPGINYTKEMKKSSGRNDRLQNRGFGNFSGLFQTDRTNNKDAGRLRLDLHLQRERFELLLDS
ncbi:MAG TPA: hypothetical protein VHO84_06985, partial [Syntrophorhabdaceae bacterium]|nr:hypothetical protein [Syntrophorhabdaceae bacterium]